MKTIVFLISLLISASSMAVDKNQLYIAVDPVSCKDWSYHRGLSDVEGASYTYWITGYLTAYNATTYDVYDVLGNTDSKDVYIKMDKYCEDNPKSHLANGMSNLIMELWPNRDNGLVQTLK